MQEQPDTQPNEADAQEPMKADLARWQRKAIKRIGQVVPFDSDVIPYPVRERIEKGLPACKTELDVRGLFSMDYSKMKPSMQEGAESIRMLAEAINKAVR